MQARDDEKVSAQWEDDKQSPAKRGRGAEPVSGHGKIPVGGQETPR